MPPQKGRGALDRANAKGKANAKKPGANLGQVGLIARAAKYEERASRLYEAIEDQLPQLEAVTTELSRLNGLLERLVVALED